MTLESYPGEAQNVWGDEHPYFPLLSCSFVCKRLCPFPFPASHGMNTNVVHRTFLAAMSAITFSHRMLFQYSSKTLIGIWFISFFTYKTFFETRSELINAVSPSAWISLANHDRKKPHKIVTPDYLNTHKVNLYLFSNQK